MTLPSDTPGDLANLRQISAWVGRCEVYHECDNGWEIRISFDPSAQNYVAVGYYPDTDFAGTFATAAIFQAGGEV
jgi:hypothetical protein